ncbi:MAG: hypothetical protein WC352_06615 [Candidatus Omnitrophota bacterium]
MSATVLPVQVAMVRGDNHKYSANSWQDRGYIGGIKDFAMRYLYGEDVAVDMDGHAIFANGDYKGSAVVTKKDTGYVRFDYKQFRKYYDTYGGMYQIYPVMSSNSLGRDLSLDIGHFGFEAGITMPDLPNVSVYYDHAFKDGSKSMLNWDTITVGGLNKKTSPSWKEIDESVDTFGIKAEHNLGGYHVMGKQDWEVLRTKTKAYEVRLSNVSGANTDQRREDTVTEGDVMTSTVGADRWYQNDKFFASSAYRFEHLTNQSRFNAQQYTANGAPNFANLNKPDASAHNHMAVNSWVANFMAQPWWWISGSTRLKAEVSKRDASSYYPNDTAATIGIIDNTGQTNTDSATYKVAETFGLRSKAIPRSAVYTDLSFEQSQNHLSVNRTGIPGAAAATASDFQTRDAVIDEPAAIWTMGADIQPFRMLNMASQFRLRQKDMSLEDGMRVRGLNGQVFLENMHTRTAGFNQRVTLKPCSWAQTSLRYLLDDTRHETRAVYDNVNEKADVLSHSWIYDMTVYPRADWSVTGSFTKQNAETKTVGATKIAGQTFLPTFTSNFYTWMFGTDYQPREYLNFNGNLFYTAANNYGDFERYNASNLVFYGADYAQVGLTAGCRWNLRKDLTIEPQYAFSQYRPNENSGTGNGYDAHVVSLALTTHWG